MCQRQAALGHHLHQVSQAELEAKIPAHAQDDDLAVKVATLEQLLDAHQLPHAHPSGSSADGIASQILPFAPEPDGVGGRSSQDGYHGTLYGSPRRGKWSTSPASTCPWKPSTCAS